MALVYAGCMGAVTFRLADRASEGPDPFAPTEVVEVEAPVEAAIERAAPPGRASILDRNGAPLAIDLSTYALYLDAGRLHFDEDRAAAAAALAEVFPEIDAQRLAARLASSYERKRTIAIKRPASPDEAQASHELGIPGLYARPRRDRLYPGGRAMAHLVGRTDVDGVGRSGVEGALNDRLRDDVDAPLRLSVDLRAQLGLRAALLNAMAATGARAATGVALDVRTGAIPALVSLPDFDPDRPPAYTPDAPLEMRSTFSRAVHGRYEFGSVFKIFTWALALETGASGFDHVFAPPEPVRIGGHRISDFHRIWTPVSFSDAFLKSSNIVSAQMALDIGATAQRRFFDRLGLTRPSGLELMEARGDQLRWRPPWTDATTATASYGHGVSTTLVQLAAATASVVNGGRLVRPTLRADGGALGPRVVSEDTSHAIRALMRWNVERGTGQRADAEGLLVGGKTGTAEQPSAGGYAEEQVIATFVAIFPSDAPTHVVAVSLDQPTVIVNGKPERGAGLTAAPAAGEAIARLAPFLSMAVGAQPDLDAAALTEIGDVAGR